MSPPDPIPASAVPAAPAAPDDPLEHLRRESPREARIDYAVAVALALLPFLLMTYRMPGSTLVLFLGVPAMGLWHLIRRAELVSRLTDRRFREEVRLAGLSPRECLEARLSHANRRLPRCIVVAGAIDLVAGCMLGWMIAVMVAKGELWGWAAAALVTVPFAFVPLRVGFVLARSALDEMVIEGCNREPGVGGLAAKGASALVLRYFVAGIGVFMAATPLMTAPMMFWMPVNRVTSSFYPAMLVTTLGESVIGIGILIWLSRRIRARRELARVRMDAPE